MTHDTASATPQRGPTYAPPVAVDQLPTSSAEWRLRTGLTDPVVIAAAVLARCGGLGAEPAYADFFGAS